MLWASITTPMCYACPVHVIILDLFGLVTLGEEHIDCIITLLFCIFVD
jgi:hypothetical protein